MSLKERLISGLHNQKDALETLVKRLELGEELTSRDCYLYELTTKEVEKELKGLRRLALDELGSVLISNPFATVTNDKQSEERGGRRTLCGPSTTRDEVMRRHSSVPKGCGGMGYSPSLLVLDVALRLRRRPCALDSNP